MAVLLLAAELLFPARAARAEAPPLRSVDPGAYADLPAGMKYGALLYHATIATGTVWDSNIFSSKDNVIADRILYVRPGLTVTTLDPNRKFTLRTSFQYLDYEVSPADNRSSADIDLRGTVRVQRGTDINLGVSAARVSEPRSSTLRRDLPQDAAEPAVHNQYAASVGLRKIFSPVASTTTIGVGNDNYFNVRSNDGTTINLQHLDRDVARVSQETDLRLSHRLLLFSREQVSMTIYRNEPGFIQDDSVKFEMVNGIEVGITPLITGRFSFQFGEEHFWDHTIESDPERIWRGELAWAPRRNLRLKASLGRDFGGVSFTQDSVGGRRTHVDGLIEYDITRQLFFRANFVHLHANEASLAGQARIENSFFYKASLGYALTRFWSLYLDYAYERREAKIEINEFDRQIIQTGVVARF